MNTPSTKSPISKLPISNSADDELTIQQLENYNNSLVEILGRLLQEQEPINKQYD